MYVRVDSLHLHCCTALSHSTVEFGDEQSAQHFFSIFSPDFLANRYSIKLTANLSKFSSQRKGPTAILTRC